MALVNPKFEFGFETIEKGVHKFRITDSGIDPQPEGKSYGRKWWVKFQVVGGGQEGAMHTESFFEFDNKTGDVNTKNMEKMAGLCVKSGLIKAAGPVDTDVLRGDAFAKRWKETMKGKEIGAKINWRYAKEDKQKETPFSNMVAYYTIEELRAIQAKASGAAPAASTTPAAPEEEDPMFN